MRSRGSLNRSRSLAIATVLASVALSLFVQAQQSQDTTPDSDTTENVESSTGQVTTEQDSEVGTEELTTENSETDSGGSNTMEETTSEEEGESSEPAEVPDFFDPSEEISEDFGVDFPVDI